MSFTSLVSSIVLSLKLLENQIYSRVSVLFFCPPFQDWAGRISIGKSYDKASSGQWIEQNQLFGVIDEFYLFERALKQSEITLLAQTCNYHRVVAHYGFELFNGKTVYDQSGLANNGLAVNGTLSFINGTCGKSANMTMGQITLPGDEFREKPQKAISISVWINLETNRFDDNLTVVKVVKYCTLHLVLLSSSSPFP